MKTPGTCPAFFCFCRLVVDGGEGGAVLREAELIQERTFAPHTRLLRSDSQLLK